MDCLETSGVYCADVGVVEADGEGAPWRNEGTCTGSVAAAGGWKTAITGEDGTTFIGLLVAQEIRLVLSKQRAILVISLLGIGFAFLSEGSFVILGLLVRFGLCRPEVGNVLSMSNTFSREACLGLVEFVPGEHVQSDQESWEIEPPILLDVVHNWSDKRPQAREEAEDRSERYLT